MKKKNNLYSALLSVQVELGDQMVSSAKFLFDEDRVIRSELILLGLRQAQVEKSLSDLRKKLKGRRK